MDTFRLEILASDHMVFDGEAQSVSLPTTEGSVGVLAHHSNVIMAVVPGVVRYQPAGDSSIDVIVSDGLLKVENGEVLVLVDTAESPEEIDVARARRAEEKAREDMKRAHSNRDMALASAELSRAMSRLRASKNKHHIR